MLSVRGDDAELRDHRWGTLTAGYRVPVDLRPLLGALESERDAGSAWDELWQELYHQGDVGEGSYVAVPHLIRVHRQRGVVANADFERMAES